MHPLASIPSPTQSVWHLGPIPVRAYALCIIAGIFVAIALTLRRWRERGGSEDDVWDVAGWAIVFGIVGGRLYHVITDPELYFKAVPPNTHAHPLNAFKIWDGGLGIWGAIALGTLGAWIGCRRKGMSLAVFADAAVPGVALAQGIGRWGNWFNNELFGGPTSLPWKLQIHDIDTTSGHAQLCGFGRIGQSVCGYYQPTFLYEFLWDVGLAVLLIALDRRLRLGRGTVFALYVMGYTVGRAWIEALRHDHANHILGLRLNDWTSLLVFLIGLAWFLRQGGFRAVREATPYTRDRAAREHDAASEDAAAGVDEADGAAPDGTVSRAGADDTVPQKGVEAHGGSDD